MNTEIATCYTNKMGRLLTANDKFRKLMKLAEDDIIWQYVINMLSKQDTGYEFTDKKCKVRRKFSDRKIWCLISCAKIDDGFCYSFQPI